MNNIFFDLDGTLINSQYRLYNLFIELCPECKMSYEKYWEIKRQRITQKDFLKKYFSYPDEQYEKFHKIWLEEVEKEERLKQDFLVEGVQNVLKKLFKTKSLYIVTNRQSKALAVKQLKDFNILRYFRDVLVTEQKKTKTELIKENIKYSETDILIGDTGEDIKTAKALGMKSCAVLWGVLNEEILKTYSPDYMLKSLGDIINIQGAEN